MEEEIEQMKEQLAEYRQQKEDTAALLELDPNDEELKELEAEMDGLIKLTTELLAMKEQEVKIRREAQKADLRILKAPEFDQALDANPPPPSSSSSSSSSSSAPPPPPSDNPFAPSATQKKPAPPPEKKKLSVQSIPKHLEILPDDPPDVIRRKKKKQYMINSNNKKVEAEIEREEKKSNWQTFISGSKRKKGNKGLSKKDSIFKSPDTVDGKVGVTGSGNQMTENPAKRPKFTHLKSNPLSS